MRVCVCVCVCCASVCLCAFAYMCVSWMGVYMFGGICTDTCVYVHMYIYVCCMQVYTFVCVSVFVQLCVCLRERIWWKTSGCREAWAGSRRKMVKDVCVAFLKRFENILKHLANTITIHKYKLQTSASFTALVRLSTGVIWESILDTSYLTQCT